MATSKYQYYETICSGSPAGRMNNGRGFNGTSGVHTHMTNSRLTDPEILELRFPVLLEDFHIRAGSGGKGKWSAGDGTRRTIRFLEKMECAILSSHRSHPPRGVDGGGDGQAGTTEIRRLDGSNRNTEGLRPDRSGGRRGCDRDYADGRRIRQGMKRDRP